MKIVIDIPEEAYKIIKGEAWPCCQEKFIEARQMLVDAVQTNSEILPKGHGRLIDADAFREYIANGIDGLIMPKDKLHKVLEITKGFLKDIDEQPIIIEADKVERERAINEWLDIHCRKCEYNDYRGTEFVDCETGCEVEKEIGIACIHYEEYIEPQVESEEEE